VTPCFPHSKTKSLPVYDHLERIASIVRENQYAVFQSPPGSGKTTVIPLYLLDEPWLAGKKIIMLQPRRLATKAVAMRMAELLGEKVGETVGYQMRLESKVSPRTRIEVITEGLLTKRLLQDPELLGVGVVIFDEFHERSIHADTGLALVREVTETLRSDLRVVVMSATLASSLSETALANSTQHTFGSAPFPVEIEYAFQPPARPLWESAASVARSALNRFSGDILLFLPGSHEINRTREILEESTVDVEVCSLYGDLPYHIQQQALLPSVNGARKVVLATTIAETSLTIEGVRVVIDSGYQKVSRYDPTTELSRLHLERITHDAADQRAGRAGRTAPGVCIRMWSQDEHRTLRSTREPEVLRAEITGILLDLAVWGTSDFEEFGWITKPPSNSLRQAVALLTDLGALNSSQKITPLGREMSRLGAEPRLAVMAIEAKSQGFTTTAAQLMTILEERDPFAGHSGRGSSGPQTSADIGSRLALFDDRARKGNQTHRLIDIAERWQRKINSGKNRECTAPVKRDASVGYLLAISYPDRIARRRTGEQLRYLLASGKGVTLRAGDPLQQCEFLVVCSLNDSMDDGRVFLASALDPSLFDGPLKHLVSEQQESTFDSSAGVLRTVATRRCGKVVLSERSIDSPSSEQKSAALEEWLGSEEGFSRIPWGAETVLLRTRVTWLQSRYSNTPLPDLTDAALRLTIRSWLSPFFGAQASLQKLSSAKVHEAILSTLSWSQQKFIESEAPTSLKLPSEKKRRIVYSENGPPILEATIQELFGCRKTPTIGSMRIPVLLHIQSPARRPIQVTQDLESFWRNGYGEVRKELRGRYPKHKWPEDPSGNAS
jgi:ATP-dependent helicase HrpB